MRRKEHIQQLLPHRVTVLRPLRQLVGQHMPFAVDIAAEPLPAAAFQLLPLLLAGLILRAFRLGAALLLLLGGGPLPLRPLEGRLTRCCVQALT